MTKLSRQIIPCQRTFPVRRNYSNAEIMVIDLVGNNGNTRLHWLGGWLQATFTTASFIHRLLFESSYPTLPPWLSLTIPYTNTNTENKIHTIPLSYKSTRFSSISLFNSSFNKCTIRKPCFHLLSLRAPPPLTQTRSYSFLVNFISSYPTYTLKLLSDTSYKPITSRMW